MMKSHKNQLDTSIKDYFYCCLCHKNLPKTENELYVYCQFVDASLPACDKCYEMHEKLCLEFSVLKELAMEDDYFAGEYKAIKKKYEAAIKKIDQGCILADYEMSEKPYCYKDELIENSKDAMSLYRKYGYHSA